MYGLINLTCNTVNNGSDLYGYVLIVISLPIGLTHTVERWTDTVDVGYSRMLSY